MKDTNLLMRELDRKREREHINKIALIVVIGAGLFLIIICIGLILMRITY